MLSEVELTTVANRQGFGSLAEIQSCVLETAGTFVIQGKEPSQSEKQFSEINARLERIENLLEKLQK